MIEIALTVNGMRHERRVEPRLLLSDFLRHELSLYGTHVGCEHGVCGACTVLLDGRPARSCLTLAVAGGRARDPRRSSRSPTARRSTRSSRRSTSTSASSAASARRGS